MTYAGEERRGKGRCPSCNSPLYSEWLDKYPGGQDWIVRGHCAACKNETTRIHTAEERRAFNDA